MCHTCVGDDDGDDDNDADDGGVISLCLTTNATLLTTTNQWKTELNIPRPERIVRASLMHTMLGGSTLWVKIILML